MVRKVSARPSRSAARRSGDSYQDIVAADLMVDELLNPGKYRWIKLENEQGKFLDDITAELGNGTFLFWQVKYAFHGGAAADPFGWENLLAKKGRGLSLVEKLSRSVKAVFQLGEKIDARLVTNRSASADFGALLGESGHLNWDAVGDEPVRRRLVSQLGGEKEAGDLFGKLVFEFGWADRKALETRARDRFLSAGGTSTGWLRLLATIGNWIIRPPESSLAGKLTRSEIEMAALWNVPRPLPEDFLVPASFVLPRRDFCNEFYNYVMAKNSACLVLTGSPGSGKSTFLSYFFRHLCEKRVPTIRHHYFLSLTDPTEERHKWSRVAESLIANLLSAYPELVKSVLGTNHVASNLRKWVEAAAAIAFAQGKRLVIILDGLDHVWRERGSAGEIDQLINHLTPLPRGLIILFGTQRVAREQLPPSLLRHCPKEKWIAIPSLDLKAIERWLRLSVNIPKERRRTRRMEETTEMAMILSRKTGGHPLLLRYAIQTLTEFSKPINAYYLRQLPHDTGSGSNEYYDGLLSRISPGGEILLNLLSLSEFVWPKRESLLELLDICQVPASDALRAISEVGHVLTEDSFGVRPFHGSLLVAVRKRPGLNAAAQLLLPRIDQWLATKAPYHLRWAHQWRIRAKMGKTKEIVEGPSMEWAARAIAQGMPRDDLRETLRESCGYSLARDTLGKHVHLEILREYVGDALQFHGEILDEWLSLQMRMDSEAAIPYWLRLNFRRLTSRQLLALAVEEWKEGNQPNVRRCHKKANELIAMGRVDEGGFQVEWWSDLLVPAIRIAAMDEGLKARDFFRYLEDSRRRGDSLRIIGVYSTELRLRKRTDRMAELLTARLDPEERMRAFRERLFLCFSEEQDVSRVIEEGLKAAQPVAVVWQTIRASDVAEKKEVGMVRGEEIEKVAYHKGTDIRSNGDRLAELMLEVYWSFVALVIAGQSNKADLWRSQLKLKSPEAEFVRGLQVAASTVVAVWRGGNQEAGYVSIYASFARQVDALGLGGWDKINYSALLNRLIPRIACETGLLFTAAGITPGVSADEFRSTMASPTFQLSNWAKNYKLISRPILSLEAFTVLLEATRAAWASQVDQKQDRASLFGDIAGVAHLHDDRVATEEFLLYAAKSILGYGWRKDHFVTGAIESVESCLHLNRQVGLERLLALSGAVERVFEYTDGKHQGSVLSNYVNALIKVSPRHVFAMYQQAAREGRFDDATDVGNVLAREIEIGTTEVVALVSTLLDNASMLKIKARLRERDGGAGRVWTIWDKTLGGVVVRSEKDGASNNPIQKKIPERLFSFHKYAPRQFGRFIREVSNHGYLTEERLLRGWTSFWCGRGEGVTAFQAIEDWLKSERRVPGLDHVFNICLQTFGKDAAFKWLVRAHVEEGGWIGFGGAGQFEARVSAVARHYPERWWDFIHETSRPAEEFRPRYGLGGSAGGSWLVRYLLSVKQSELADEIVEVLISSLMERLPPACSRRSRWTSV
jgi:hypothetical protein